MSIAKDTEDIRKAINWWIRKDVLIALGSAGLAGSLIFDLTLAAFGKMLGAEIDWFPTTKVIRKLINNIDEIIDELIEASSES